MRNTKYLLKEASFLFIVLLMISTSVSVIAENQAAKSELISLKSNKILNKEFVDSTEISNQPQGKFISVIRGWAVGNASSGKTIGTRGKIAIIKFDHVIFTQLKFLPLRWEMADFYDVTAIVFRLDQTIPEGPFEFKRERVVAIIF